ncbi:roadblock/LC7 domain-containing protein [Streptomyces calidiresistens]|uniref:Roadblock/LC7 domain-containing protein n=2 Tax=Streptomyces TaxID=1883 RepID=A0A7W3TB54_9ACTN|nr:MULTISPECIES: roadblock/LC7 domain-containing protein [Streptomyces]MBB0229945.1 roadblock/LC7 domain-containing protein [Streptomyces calidiresistens]MBB0243599.1 roadblock/LC7 domain-containing protein [Streptomyces alkaliphilus]MCE7080124.1 roadblock/LC7 domain-containing protein [Streptomyces sp. ST2-7A]
MTHNRDAWMLKQVLEQPEVYDAILVSADGLVTAHSDGLDRDKADRIAAALSGVQSTSSQTAAFCRVTKDAWQQSLVQFKDGFVITIPAGDGAYLAVAASGSADIAQIGYRMHEVVGQLGGRMNAEPRQDTGNPA